MKLILKIRIGSRLYGTSTKDSDEDYAGIFIPSPEHILGLKNVEEIDLGAKEKRVDYKLYSLQKFVRLALANNPNILEMLFVNEDNILEITEEGKELLNLKYHFLSKRLKPRFLGYASSQRKKMVIKLENYDKLVKAYKFLDQCDEKFLLDITPNELFVRKPDHLRVGDVNIPITITVKRTKSLIKDRLDKFGNRKKLVSKYGYDTKFAMHLLRLLYEGIELLGTGNLKFPLEQRKFLIAVRRGKYELTEVLKIAEELESDLKVIYNLSDIPDEPDKEFVEKWLINTHLNYLKSL